MEIFQENYAKLYNFIISKKELKFRMTNVLLPHLVIEQFYEIFKKFNKKYVNFNTRKEIRSYFPKLLKEIDLSILNYLLLNQKEFKCSFKSLYNHFEEEDKVYAAFSNETYYSPVVHRSLSKASNSTDHVSLDNQ
jgi:hypothetical protein